MKKIAAALMALLLLTRVFSAFALVKSMDIPIDEQGLDASAIHIVLSAATAGDKLYLVTYDGSFVWDDDTGKLMMLTLGGGLRLAVYGSTLVSDGDTLYHVDINGATITKLAVSGRKITVVEKITFDNEGLIVADDTYPDPVALYSAALHGGKLYLLTGAEDLNDDRTRVLHEIDMRTGKRETLLSGTNLNGMTAYKDGNLLMKLFDQDKYYNGRQSESDLPTLTVFDIKQRKLTQTLLTPKRTDISGIVYDEKTDNLYMAMDGQLFRQTGTDDMEAINYVMNESYNELQKAMLIGSAHYVLVNYSGVFIRSTDPNDRPSEVLRVSGVDFSQFGQAGYRAFLRAHPEVVVIPSQDTHLTTAEALYQDFLSATAGDVYVIDDMGTLAALIKKGYCMDLSGSSKLTEAVQSMYPNMAQPLYNDGKLYAVPFVPTLNPLIGFSPSLFEEIGIAKEDVPNTIMEFMDFLVDWVDIYADAYPYIDLFRMNYTTARNVVLNLIFTQQLIYCQRENIPVTFDTPEMHELLRRLDEVSPIISELDAYTRNEGSLWLEDEPLNALIDPFFFFSFPDTDQGYNLDYEPMLLGFTDDIPMLIMLSMEVLMVNPNTKNPETAIALLESLVDDMEANYAFRIFEDMNEPLEDPNYQRIIKNLGDYKLSLEVQLAKETDELTIKLLQERLEDALVSLKATEKNRYTISAEAITFYHSITPNVYPAGEGITLINGSENLTNLLERYIGAQITSEQFIKETEKILRMIYLENP